MVVEVERKEARQRGDALSCGRVKLARQSPFADQATTNMVTTARSLAEKGVG